MAGLTSAAPVFQNLDPDMQPCRRKHLLSGKFFTSELFAVGGEGGEVSLEGLVNVWGVLTPNLYCIVATECSLVLATRDLLQFAKPRTEFNSAEVPSKIFFWSAVVLEPKWFLSSCLYLCLSLPLSPDYLFALCRYSDITEDSGIQIW